VYMSLCECMSVYVSLWEFVYVGGSVCQYV
jgi:hypothetical protein